MKEELLNKMPDAQEPDTYLRDLLQHASIDMLSGLLNRSATERFIKERLERMSGEDTCALFIVDLDDFKHVNDMLGHPAGDQVIRQTARMLSGLFRANDIVGRLGGDEFVAFLCGRVTEEQAAQRAAEICDTLQMVLGDGQTVNVTASVGVYLAAKGQAFEGLYRSADLALYKAKKAGKHRFFLKNRDESPDKGGSAAGVITLGMLLENMDGGVALVEMGEEPQLTYASAGFYGIIGADPALYPLPRPFAELLHPDDRDSAVSMLRDSLARGQLVETTRRLRSGEGQVWPWCRVRAAVVDHDSVPPVMMLTVEDVSRFNELLLDHEHRIRLLKTAFDLTASRLWEVDLRSRTFRTYAPGSSDAPDVEFTPFPESLMDGGWIHPNCVARFRQFAGELLRGQFGGAGNFAIRRRAGGCYGWVSASYRILFSDAGRAERAVGILADLPQSFTGGAMCPPHRYRMPESLVADVAMWMRADLTKDRVEELWDEGNDLSSRSLDLRCAEVLQKEKGNIFCKEERKSVYHILDREELLRRYAAGERWHCVEYRRTDRGGCVRWVRHILYLTQGPSGEDVYLHSYLLRLDPDHVFEQVLRGETKRDAVTRLYVRDTVQRVAENLFSGRKSGNRAVAVLQVDGLEQEALAPKAERLRYEIAAGLSLVLGGGCLLGQYSPQRTVVVFSDVVGKEGLRRRMEEALRVLRCMLAYEPAMRSVRFVMGIDVMPAAAANYRSMLAQAIRACASQLDAPADAVAFSRELEEPYWMPAEEDQADVLVQPTPAERTLSGTEKDLALDGMSAMLSARTLDMSVLGAFRAIGEYYRADRVYSLMLVEEQNSVIMTFEWTNGAKRSIQRVVSGLPLERFPLLRQCMRERRPIFLAREGAASEESARTERPWHFVAYPLIDDELQAVQGFLCIENAREHTEEARVLNTLVPFILQQRARFGGMEYLSLKKERQSRAPDTRAYIEALHTLNSEYYSSMGAVCLDIPGLPPAEDGRSAYWSAMLSFVADTLTELFGRALLFRTREAEFVAFYPNTTREVFLGCCGRLWTILQRRYPKQARIGQAWSGGVFFGKRLAEEAAAAMKNMHADLFARDLVGLRSRLNGAADWSALEEAEFTVFFQPKVNTLTGELMGMEALARRLGKDGEIIPPSRFVPMLEQTGTVRELDLFVLERSLAQVERWRAAGLGVVPVAVNLSRKTLAHPATLASVLAIQSRYPDIPGSALELEITENDSGLGNEELREFVDRFHTCGLRMSLDDFGAQYANLSLLVDVKFETVKLDRSLVAKISDNPISQMLVRSLVQICKTCGMTCVAEGVETQAQVSVLQEMDCACVQGYFFDRPLPADEFEQKYLRKTSA